MRGFEVAVAGVLFLAAGLLAGCLGGGDSEGQNEDAAERAVAWPEPFRAIVDGGQARGFVDSFAMEHPTRRGGGDSHEAARQYLETTLEGFGLVALRHEYDTGVNILGSLPGAVAPQEWVVLSAHYDTTASTIYGAWDDGAGSALLLELARAFSEAHGGLNRTVVFAFFDQEESGLIGSGAFVREYSARDDVQLVGNLNFDPPGLNWPCRNPDGSFLPLLVLHSDLSTPGQEALREAVLAARQEVGVPDDGWAYRPDGIAIATVNGGGLSGTSDHANFAAADIPNLFIGGDVPLVVGPVAAMTYALHTPIDTLAQMDARCGGPGLLEEGFQAAGDLAYHTVRGLDRVAGSVLVDQQAEG